MDVAVALPLPLLIGLIAVALLFDFLNGLHDAANSIATIVSTRVLRPQYAVFWAAFFNFIAFLFFGLHVAQTVGTGIIAPDVVDPRVIFAALVGAISWNVITWWAGIPSSSSHALIGGLVGAGTAKAGIGAIVWWGLGKTAAAIALSPVTGFVLALALVLIASWTLLRATPSRSTALSGCCSSFPPRSTRWDMGAMTPRKSWASSPSSFTRKVCLRGSTSRSGSSSVVRPPWDSERCSADGGLFTPWAQRSRACHRCRDSAPKRAARSPYSRRPIWAYRYQPPIRSPARSLASAQHGESPPCAGTWQATSWWLG
jgi:phosphate/sulfate permease